MTDEQFCYWLQGFVEVVNSDSITSEQWIKVVNRLPPEKFDIWKVSSTPIQPMLQTVNQGKKCDCSIGELTPQTC